MVAALILVAALSAGVVETSTVFERRDPHGYRIPGIAVTKDGTVLAFAERRIGLHDHAQNDIVLRRSSDGGRTWQPEQVLRDEGGDSLNDPCAVTLSSGRILLRYKRYPRGFHARKSGHTQVCDTGYDGPRVVRVYLMHSDDDGATWTQPREITRQARAAGSVSAGSPGNGIELTRGPHKGRVVMPLYETFYPRGKRMWKTRAMFSDDGGASWTTGDYIPEGPPPGYGNEAAVAELSDGSILFSARNQGGTRRKLAVSRDGGRTWGAYAEHSQLVTPACMGGLLRYAWPEGDKAGVLVHSLPYGRSRSNGVILLSRDDGKTWPERRVLDPGAFAYSCLARLHDGSIGCLYEAGGYKQIKFARFPLAWVEAGDVPAADNGSGVGFEGFPPGEFTRLESDRGTWLAEAGHAEVDPAHAHGGRQCLHVFGGNDRRVEFVPGSTVKLTGKLRFKAERWTRRDPFVFRVHALRNGKWEEVYNGDKRVRVGRAFLSDVTVLLGKTPAERLRFTCTAPPKSGILIDDLQFEESGPMKVSGVTVSHPHTPVLVRNENDPVLRITVNARGDEDPVSVTGIRVSMAGTTRLADVASVSVVCSGTRDAFASLQPFSGPEAPQSELFFKGKHELQSGENNFWVSCALCPDADLLHVVDAGCLEVTLSNGDVARPQLPSPHGVARFGIALRKGGDDGSKVYRIPGLATTPKGTLIGVYDVRYRGGGDLPGDIDVGMSRSTDGGQTWEPMKVIMDMGRDPKWRYDGIGDPSVLVDRETGTIWVAATWSHGNRSWRGSGPGMEPAETGQFILVRSDDEGVTWSGPINITRQIKKPEWCFVLQGPGRGITMRDGTLVFPAQYQDPPEKRRTPHSTVIYSRDHGKTWRIGTGAKPDTTEAAVVELGDGSLMLNMRDNRGGSRSVYTSGDMGATWTQHITSRRALPEPVCMASLLRIPAEGNALAKDLLLFSNPAVSRAPRRRTTVKLSFDEGRTWPEAQHLLLDAGISAGYSCLTQIDRETIGILYEGSRAHMTFQKVKLTELVSD